MEWLTASEPDFSDSESTLAPSVSWEPKTVKLDEVEPNRNVIGSLASK